MLGCGDLAGKSQHLIRAQSHPIEVEGDVNNGAHWLAGSWAWRIPTASQPSLFILFLLFVQKRFFQPSVVSREYFSPFVYILVCSWEGVSSVSSYAAALLDL